MVSKHAAPATHSPPLTAPLLAAALALALALPGLTADSFWGDEILTATFAGHPPAEVIRWTVTDIHPPLYYLAAGLFTRLMLPPGLDAGPAAADWLWRFPSVIALVLTVAVTYRLGRSMFRSVLPVGAAHAVAAAAALLFSVAPIALKYGQEARMHALFMLLSALSTLLLFRALSRPRRWQRWLLFGLVTAANLYTMYFGFLILAAQAGLVAALSLTLWRAGTARAGGQLLARFAGAVGLSLLLYLPWGPVLFDILRRRAAVGAIEGGVGSPLAFVSGVVMALGPPPPLAAWLFFGLFLAGLLLLARQAGSLALLAGLWLGLPALLPIFLGDPRALQFRYAFVLPLYLIVIAYSLWRAGGAIARVDKLARQRTASYLTWALATVSFIGVLSIYGQVKPDWRSAAAYLNRHTAPADIILIGPLWDEGRFIGYYYRGQAQLLTPAALVTNIEGRAAGLRQGNGRIWAVNRFAPAESNAFKNIEFPGVVVSEPQVAVYEPAILATAAIDLARQAVDAAYPWAATAEAQGVLDPDPRTAQASALRALGDALLAAGRPGEAIAAYQTAVDIFPGWVGGFLALAEAHEVAGNERAAAEAYRQAVAYNLRWHGPAANEAAALLEAGNWPAAVEKYHQITGNQATQR